jgi:hypothetical protein
MRKIEKHVLRKIIEIPHGLLSQSDLISCLPDGDTRISHSLITSGYLEEVIRRIKATQIEVTYYRLTERGRAVLGPWYFKFWFVLRNDIRTVIVATITAVAVSVMSRLI